MTATQLLGTIPESISICTIASKPSSAISIRVSASVARSNSLSCVFVGAAASGVLSIGLKRGRAFVMEALSSNGFVNANNRGERSCTSKCTNVRAKNLTAAVMQVLHSAFGPRKNIARRADCSLRTIQNWQAGDRQLQLENLLFLLEGSVGVDVFQKFWDQIPEVTRERWFKGEVLRRQLEKRERERAAEDVEIDQLRLELARR
jgi:hypothetical protein